MLRNHLIYCSWAAGRYSAFNEENHYELKIIAGFYDNTEKHDMSRLEKLPQSLKVL